MQMCKINSRENITRKLHYTDYPGTRPLVLLPCRPPSSVFLLQERGLLWRAAFLPVLQQYLHPDAVRQFQLDNVQHNLDLTPHLPVRAARAEPPVRHPALPARALQANRDVNQVPVSKFRMTAVE